MLVMEAVAARRSPVVSTACETTSMYFRLIGHEEPLPASTGSDALLPCFQAEWMGSAPARLDVRVNRAKRDSQ